MVDVNLSAVTVVSSRPVSSLVAVDRAGPAVPQTAAARQPEVHFDMERRRFDPIICTSPLFLVGTMLQGAYQRGYSTVLQGCESCFQMLCMHNSGLCRLTRVTSFATRQFVAPNARTQ